MPFLRQSTAQIILFGPCLDKTDGVTEETVLTLAQTDMRLSKDGGAFAQKSAVGNATHDSDGWYSTSLSTTDTDTVGELVLNVHQPANMLPVWLRFWVLEENVYDAWFAASGAAGTDLGSVLTDTNELQGDWVNGGRLDLLLDAIPTTAMRGTDSAALASEVTSARMSELDDSAGKLVAVADLIKIAADAIKLETDKLTLGNAGAGVAGSIIEEIENRPTTAMRGTDGVDTGTHIALVNLIWNELISEARTAGSYGQRLKDAVGLDTLTAAQVAALTDWIDAGRLDAILDLIKTEADKIALVTAGAGVAGSVAEIILNIDTAAMRGTDGVDTAAMRGTDSAALALVATEARLAELDAANLPSDVDAILLDTGTSIPTLLPAVLVGGRIDADIGAKTGNVALSAQEKLDVNIEVDNAFTTQLADSVPADGTISTRDQALYIIEKMLTEFAISGTTMTVKKVDGTTTLMTFTLDDATNPTSLTRTT